MSLLLDALKRAEEAKKAQAEAAASVPTFDAEPLSLEPLAEQSNAIASDIEPQPITRDSLPNISQAMEILPEDLGSPARATDPSAKKHGAAARPHGKPAQDIERSAARQLFEAKTPAYNPRRPFYITLGALGTFAIAAAGYFWYQLQPPSITARSLAPVSQGTVAHAAPAPSPRVEAAPPPQVLSSVARPVIEDTPAAATTAPMEPPRRQPASAPAQTPRVTLIKSAPQGPSPVERGYEAFEKGDLQAARAHYQEALTRDPLSRDALLGLAAVDMREGQYGHAHARYEKLLEIDPRDPYAHAGLIGLRGRSDPVTTESRLKTLLAQRPDAEVLHFTLGNLYAQQARWPEAQQTYFKAYTSDPNNPDYAFNLAVSLDQLQQRKLALEYYSKALLLAQSRPAAFSAPQAEARVRELSR